MLLSNDNPASVMILLPGMGDAAEHWNDPVLQ